MRTLDTDGCCCSMIPSGFCNELLRIGYLARVQIEQLTPVTRCVATVGLTMPEMLTAVGTTCVLLLAGLRWARKTARA